MTPAVVQESVRGACSSREAADPLREVSPPPGFHLASLRERGAPTALADAEVLRLRLLTATFDEHFRRF